jgi:hypothetical protein
MKKEFNLNLEHIVAVGIILLALLILTILNISKIQPATATPTGTTNQVLAIEKGGTGRTDFAVINDLTSTSTTNPLSAAMGKQLAEIKATRTIPVTTKSTGAVDFNDFKCTGETPVQYFAGDWTNATNAPLSKRIMGNVVSYCRGQLGHSTQVAYIFYYSEANSTAGVVNYIYTRNAGNPTDSSWSAWTKVF